MDKPSHTLSRGATAPIPCYIVYGTLSQTLPITIGWGYINKSYNHFVILGPLIDRGGPVVAIAISE